MKSSAPLIQLSSRGQVTLPAGVRNQLHLQAGNAFRVLVEDGRIVLEPVEVLPIEIYSEERVREFLENSDMTDEELSEARTAWDL
jgi:AbrB family looped-hinge helix DNA binding protein